MKKVLTIIVIVCLALPVLRSNAQSPAKPKTSYPSKPAGKSKKDDPYKTNLEIGGGVMGSVLYLTRNTKDKNDALGYAISANYGGKRICRLSFQYTYYKPINIEPTWYNIKAQTFESNVEVLARFKNNKTLLYPFAGISYNTFKGYFTGLNDFQGLREIYKVNSTVKENWLGLNFGTGIEHAFGPLVIYADYRMRIGPSKSVESGLGINIMDVCYGAGLRLKISAPTLKKLYKGLNDKYKWF